MFIYAMDDIHDEKEAFEDALSVVDLSDGNMLILCGDYIDRRQQHLEFLTYIREFQASHEKQIIALMGNHEVAYLKKIAVEPDGVLDLKTIKWLRNLPLRHETDTQIFVHAGVDEGAGDLWEVDTEDYSFYKKHPQTYGSFEKGIAAGHIGTYQMCGESRVFWDGQSHFYIDGTTEESKFVPVLKFDTERKQYMSFKKTGFKTEGQKWSEYVVRPENAKRKEWSGLQNCYKKYGFKEVQEDFKQVKMLGFS